MSRREEKQNEYTSESVKPNNAIMELRSGLTLCKVLVSQVYCNN